MNETIGRVTLDLTAYRGDDQYSDGAVELALLDWVKKADAKNSDRMPNSWPFLYHLSPIRHNLVSWLPIKKTETVLEIGSGCGALTGALAGLAGKVRGIELSYRRCQINAWRHRVEDNIELQVGSFADCPISESYDWVTLIGVLEYAGDFMPQAEGEGQVLAMLDKAVNALKPKGRLVLAIENRFGLKYWNGSREDHNGRLFSSIEGYPGSTIHTWSRPDLERLLGHAGYRNLTFYYPFPDYKLPTAIYSDRHLPRPGDLRTGLQPFDQDRYAFFDEGLVWDQLTSLGQLGFFANSFLVIAER